MSLDCVCSFLNSSMCFPKYLTMFLLAYWAYVMIRSMRSKSLIVVTNEPPPSPPLLLLEVPFFMEPAKLPYLFTLAKLSYPPSPPRSEPLPCVESTRDMFVFYLELDYPKNLSTIVSLIRFKLDFRAGEFSTLLRDGGGRCFGI